MAGKHVTGLFAVAALFMGAASVVAIEAEMPRLAAISKVLCVVPEQAHISLTLQSDDWRYLPLSQPFDVQGSTRSSCANWPNAEVNAFLFCTNQLIDVGAHVGNYGFLFPSISSPEQESICELRVEASNLGGVVTDVETRTLIFLADVQQRPTVTLVSPVSANLVWPTALSFSANATGAAGFPIERVQFVDRSSAYATGLRVLGEDSTAPFSLPNQTLLPGRHSIRAIAIDSRGYRALSTPALIDSAPNQAPILRLTNPLVASSTPLGTAVEIRLEATDVDGYVKKVDFYSDSKTKLGSVLRGGPSSEPFVYSWTPLAAKGYEIYAIAEDDRGLIKSVGPVPVTVTNAAPLLTLAQPVDGVFIAHPGAVPLAVTVSDDQSLSQVSYVITPAVAGVRGCDPATILATAAQGFAASWVPPCGGRYRVQARATDSGGTTATSGTNDVFVTKPGTNVEPYTRLTSPANSAYLKPGMTLNLTAQARDDGSTASVPGIVQVNFFLDGALIKSVTTSQSYNSTTRISVWTTTYVLPSNTTIGLHQVTANAQEGASGVSPQWGISPQVPINLVANIPTWASLSLSDDTGTLTMPVTTSVIATMADPDGSLVRNEFYRNDVLVASSTPPQTQLTWTPDESGTHIWRMRVLDSSGVWTEARIEVTVLRDPARPVPNVSIVSQVAGQMINRSVGDILVRILAADSPSGPVRYVELFDGIQRIGRADTRSDETYHINWPAPTEGGHRLTARAVGQLGAISVTPPINVFVTSASPQISIVAPTTGTSGFVAPENIWASVNASDDVGVTEIRYYLDSDPSPVATILPPSPGAPVPLDFVYENLPQGQHTLRARAYDAGGNFTDSSTVTITVAANTLPTAQLTAPTSSGPYLEGARIAFHALVSDPDENAIDRVEFLDATDNAVAMGQLLLGGPTPTYRGYWTAPASASNYSVSIRARATDRRDGTGTSSPPRTINIVTATPPLVSFATPVLPGSGNLIFVGEPVQLSAVVTDPDANLGGRITHVEFLRHYSSAGNSPASEVIHTETSSTSTTYQFNWIASASHIGQTSSFSVTAYDDGPATRNSTTVSSSQQVQVQNANHAPTNVRFLPRQIGATPVVPAMPSLYAPGLQSPIDIILPYRVQAGGVMHLCAFATDDDGNLAGVRFFLGKPGFPERTLAETTVLSPLGSYCSIQYSTPGGNSVALRGYAAEVALSVEMADADVQFIRAEAFDTRELKGSTSINPARDEPGHIACFGDRFTRGSSSLLGSPCVKFSIPVAIMDAAAITSPCGNDGGTGVMSCATTRFRLPVPGVDPNPSVPTVLEAERYDSGGQGLALFEKDFVPGLSPRQDRSRISCDPAAPTSCKLVGFDNGEFRRYSVTMPVPGSIEYTVKFKPNPYPQLTVPARDIYIERVTPNIPGSAFNPLHLEAKVTAHQLGRPSDSQSKVDFILERLTGNPRTEVVLGAYGNGIYHSADWTAIGTGLQTWRVRAKITTVFHPAPGEDYVIEGQFSEWRTVEFVDQLPVGYVAPEQIANEEPPGDRDTFAQFGEFEGHTPSTECPARPPVLETIGSTTTGWFLQRSCPIGLPVDDYYFNLHSEADGTEVDSIRFDYVSSATSGISLVVAAPHSGDEFPVNATIGLQAEFNGANENSTVVYEISNASSVVATIGDGSYPAFQRNWTPEAPGGYSIRALGRLSPLSSQLISGTVSFVVLPAASNPAPQVALTNPSTHITWQTGTPLPLAMTATDADGIASASFLLVKGSESSTVTATISGQAYQASWTPTVAGTYTVSAQATDSLGAIGTSPSSPARTITVTTSTTPTVSITANPSTGLIAPATTVLKAIVSGGTNVSVNFERSNGAQICTGVRIGSTNEYGCSWNGIAIGSYSIQARATVDGQVFTSNSLTVTVTAPLEVSATRTYVYDSHQRLCKVINPESGATFFGYDAAGNLEWTVEGSTLTGSICDRAEVQNSTQRIMRTYDEMNRLRVINYPDDTADVLYTYEDDGALDTVEVTATAQNPGNKWSYDYNNRRMLKSESLLLDTQTYNVGYSYNDYGYLTSLSYPVAGNPNGRTVSYAPNALGQATVVSDTSMLFASNISYHANGAIKGFNYGNGVRHDMTQNTRRLPMRSLSANAAGVKVVDDTYHYDQNGNVTRTLDGVGNGSSNRDMIYDDLDRLTGVLVASGLWNYSTYTYDALDNIRSADQGGRQYRYEYNTKQHLTQMYDPTSTSQINLGYNAVGDVISKAGIDHTTHQPFNHTYTYDAAHRLLSVPNVASYRYDGHGRRVKETKPSVPDEIGFYNQAGQKLYSKKAGVETNNIYFGGSLLATIETDSSVQPSPTSLTYLHTDSLGSVVAHTDANGAIQDRYRYTPYGETFGTTLNGLGYTGHDMDQETGLTYMQQRYYDPVIGRFMAVDPVGASTENFNRYWYANNNPYGFVDPDGRKSCLKGGLVCSRIAAQSRVSAKNTKRRAADTSSDPYTNGEVPSPRDPNEPAWTPTQTTIAQDVGEYAGDLVDEILNRFLPALGPAGAEASVGIGMLGKVVGARRVTEVASVTLSGSRYANLAVNIGAKEFQSNLLGNGYKLVKQTVGSNGQVTILSNGTKTYAIYTATSTGGFTAQVTNAAGDILSKIRLAGP